MGVEPTVTGALNVTEPVMGPEIVFCIGDLVVGSMYMTVADPMVMEAPVYVPCGTEIMASGCMTPIRCIISMGVEAETTVAELPLPVKDMVVMFIENASIQSAGESPISTWTTVFEAGVGVGLGFLPADMVPPPHPVSAAAQTIVGIRTDRASRRRLGGAGRSVRMVASMEQ